jgi:cystinosin
LFRKRKSTTGWSIWMVLLDFAGGVLSLFQLCLEAWVLQDPSLITGDAIKFGLGLVSIIYNLLFIVRPHPLPNLLAACQNK